ncbi:patatin-like phospholipase family protein [Thermodesulfobacteriota bacterium]
MEKDNIRDGIALSLSGGGFRATLFHVGALWRLNELGYLKDIKRICSVSGGSITAGYLGYKWKDLKFDQKGVASNFTKQVVNPLKKFCSLNVDFPSILGGWLSILKTPSDLLEKKYNRFLFKDATLQDLPTDKEGPRFIIYATSLQTGVSVRFSKPYIGEYHLGTLKNPEILLAKAVAASSAFPPVLTPLLLETKPDEWQKQKGADLYDKKFLRKRMYLTDGGVYDNLALEAAWNFETVLVSDAGAPFEPKLRPWILKYSQLKKMLRVLEITIEQTRALRKRWLIKDLNNKERKGTYWGISTDIDDYKLDDPMVHDNNITDSMQKLPTRLCPFSKKDKGRLINWGYALADAAMRRWVLKPGTPKGDWPEPKYPLDQDCN